MKLITEYGKTSVIDDSDIPDEMNNYNWQKVYAIRDEIHLEYVWVASVFKKEISSNVYECVGEAHYDHEPNEDELLFLLRQYDALNVGYVTVVDKSYIAAWGI